MTIQEQIKALEATRQAKAARLEAITKACGDDGRTKNESEQEEFDTLMREVEGVDKELADLSKMEKMNITRAAPVTPAAGEGSQPAAVTRAGGGTPHVLSLRGSGLPKGTAFTRYAMALAITRGSPHAALEIAKRWKDTPEVEEVLKAAVAAGTTTDATWAGNLVAYTQMVSEFVELLRAATIIGKFGTGGIPSLRRVPFNIRMATQTGGGTYNWVGQGAAKPVGKLTLGEITLKWAKAAGIIVITDELARFSNPSAEAVVRNDMIKGMAAFCDAQFVNPDVAEVADVSPASIFNGASPITATGSDADALRRDLGSLWDAFFAANLTPTTGVFIMSNRQSMRLSLMRNALGGKEFPDITPLGGVLEGFPVIASEAVPDDSNGGQIGFVNADDIFYADDGPVTIDASREASLQMNDAPDEPTSASTVLVSLWQRNLIGLRAEVYRNWKKRRAAAANFIQGANYR